MMHGGQSYPSDMVDAVRGHEGGGRSGTTGGLGQIWGEERSEWCLL